MKKLLLLGGSKFIIPVIDACHNLDIKAITCDYLPDNVAHKYSDEYHNVSIVDKDKILALAENLEVDGILSFACDPGVETMAYVCEKLGLPCAGSYESISILQNKARFRKFLADNGFNVPKANGYDNVNYAMRDAASFKWPVIIKPVDSAGSKGVTRVDTPESLSTAVEYALEYSKTKHFIMEEFIESVGCSSDTDCFSVDGELKFVSFSAQRFDPTAKNPYVPSAYSWPATISTEHQTELTSEIARLLKLLNMKTSVYNVETREATDGKAYIMELTPRGGGNRLSEMLKYATGVDLITNSVRGAVGDEVIGMEQRSYNGHWAEIILHADKDGRFDGLEIDKSLESAVVERDIWVKEGDLVNGFTGANEAIGTLVLHFENGLIMEKVMKNTHDYVRIRVK